MVKALHDAGIEVILDVVYNHTAEGNHLGPTLSFKGIDNAAYYRLVEDDQQYYMDYTGTGNTLNVRHPHSLQLIMDSLRYWVTEMHVDGFRFDLASTLAREFYDVDRLSTFFELVQQDPVGQPGEADRRAVGHRPRRLPGRQLPAAVDRVERQVPRHRPRLLARRAARSASSPPASPARPTSTSTPAAGRSPSINFVTAHDGFTLRDLVSYNEKHNEANGEDNNDGESHNRSWNYGVEGPTDDPEILRARARAQRNFLATLLLSQGVPMILHGDELGRTQHGNNNTYAQDSELTWMHWDEVDTPADRVHRRGRQAPRRAPDVPPQAASSPARPCARATSSASTTSSGCTPTAARWPTATGTAHGARAIGMYLNGHGIAGKDATRQPHHRRPLPALLQRRTPIRWTSPCRPRSTPKRGTSSSTPQARRTEPNPLQAGARAARSRRAASLVLIASTPAAVEPPRRHASVVWRSLRSSRTDRAETDRMDANRHDRAPPPAPTGCRSPRTSTWSAAARIVCLPARARRRLGLPLAAARVRARQRPRLRRRPTTGPIDPSRGRAAGLAALAAEAQRLGMGVLVDIVPNHVGVARAGGERVVVGRAHPRARSRRTPAPSTSTGRPAAAACGSRSSATTTCGRDGRIDNLQRRSAASCATTTTASRWRPDTARGADEDPDAVHARQHYELVSWREADSSLNYRRFFAVNTLAAIRVEDPRVVRPSRTPRSGAGSTRASSTGCGSTTPTACATPAATSRTWPTLTGGAYVLVEKILEHGRDDAERGAGGPALAWATAGTTGYDALALIDRVLIDPAGEAAADATWRTRLRGDATSTGRSWSTTPSAPSPTASCTPRCAGSPASCSPAWTPADSPTSTGWRTRSPSCSPASRSTAPTCPRAASTSTGPSARPGAPPRPRPRARPALPGAGRRRVAPGPALPADHRHGDGQGRRGHRVLPLDPAHLAQRGRRRPELFFASRSTSSTARWRCASRSGRDAMTRRTTHDTKRGEDVRARITVLAELPRAVGGGARRAARAWRRCPTPGSATCCGRRSSAPGRPTGTGCTPTRRRPCARPATTPAGPPRTPASRPPCTLRRRRLRRPRGARRARPGAGRASSGRAGATRSPPSCSS